MSFILLYSSQRQDHYSSIMTAQNNGLSAIAPIDQLASAAIALNVSKIANLPEQVPIRNQADSESALLSLPASTGSIVSKPNIVQSSYISNKNIISYVVRSGDSIASIAKKFNVSTNSIIWSNNIVGSDITPGVKILIPPTNGIIYTVKSGDTPQSIAKTYKSSASLIISYNDAELSGLTPNEKIIIPNGQAPAPVSYSNNYAAYGLGSQPTYGYNGYDFGYCTWWVASQMAQHGVDLPTNLGNASTWGIRAAEFGIPVSSIPKIGAAVVTSTYGEGHVAYVTAINPDGTITISEMNHAGWDIVDTRNISAAGYQYIY